MKLKTVSLLLSKLKEFNLKRIKPVFVAGLLCVVPFSVYAQNRKDAASLGGTELTPIGAERAANKDGSIPEWTGGLPKAGRKPGVARPDLFASDKPLYSINASNVTQHASLLSAGQLALLKLSGYRMDVYPSRRTCSYPDFHAARTKTNVTKAKLSSDGIRLEDGLGAAVLFPFPQSGAEALWNHKTRYRGEGTILQNNLAVSPKSGDPVLIVSEVRDMQIFNNPRVNDFADYLGSNYWRINTTSAPAQKAGEVIFGQDSINDGINIWLYNPGQRRVRRAPALAHDNSFDNADGLVTVDQYEMWTGTIDRYDWKLIGKQELIVPYNNFRIVNAVDKWRDLLKPQYISRDAVRYERHRVWKVEGTVKQGKRHLATKRVMYFDEDSWTIVAEDLYDAQGQLWRTMENVLIPAPELPACVDVGTIAYDLAAGRYLFDSVVLDGSKLDLLAGREGRIDPKWFTPDSIRSQGTR
jgi:hypothetical protein